MKSVNFWSLYFIPAIPFFKCMEIVKQFIIIFIIVIIIIIIIIITIIIFIIIIIMW